MIAVDPVDPESGKIVGGLVHAVIERKRLQSPRGLRFGVFAAEVLILGCLSRTRADTLADLIRPYSKYPITVHEIDWRNV